MNFQNYNILKIKYDKKNIQLLKKIFSKMSYIRQFELRAYENKLKNKFQTLIYLCLGQAHYALCHENATDYEVFGSLENIKAYFDMHGKIFIFLGESKHKIKKKAEQSACQTALQKFEN